MHVVKCSQKACETDCLFVSSGWINKIFNCIWWYAACLWLLLFIPCAAMQSLENQIWRSWLATWTNVHLTNVPVWLDCWAISKTDARRIDASDQWCLRMLLGIKWYQFVWNDDVRRLSKQPKLTAIIPSRQLSLFGHIMRTDDNADAKRILLVSPLADWRRQPGRLCITWFSTLQHHLTPPEAADLAQNRPQWRMMLTYGAMQS